MSHDINHDTYYNWIKAIRPEYINNSDYDDVARDDSMVCKPCFEEAEERIKVQTKQLLVQPTAEEIELHEVAHVPFRSWCKFCIMGKGVASAHHIGASTDSLVPIIIVDYAFMGSTNEKQEAQ